MERMLAFARWLTAKREEVRPKLTMSALAAESGVVPNYISRLENVQDGRLVNPIMNPSPERVTAIVRVLERYLERPLLNEARTILGQPTLDDEPPVVAAEEMGKAPDPATFLRVANQMRYWPRDWRKAVVEVAEEMSADKPSKDDRGPFKTREAAHSLAAA